MAAFSNFHLSVADALVRRASVFPARPAIERASIRFAAAVQAAAAAVQAAPAAVEIGMFLWLALAIAFGLLVMAGFCVTG
ncbi:MAG TPA: hypothetical protein VNY80_11280 [Steroidobacteraceae bacterium]|nr:hypothetical protein [Steroidobacteraceae bacterium]